MAKKTAAAPEVSAVPETTNAPLSIETRLREIFGDVTDEQIVKAVEAFGQCSTRKISKRQFKKWRVISTTFGPKTPLQMQQAVMCVESADPVDMKTWAERLAAYEGFKTNQPVERIIAFYKARMIAEGLVEAVAE